jgi:hypothetical protein
MFHTLLLALVLIFFLPGFLLVNAIFPRKGELDRTYDRLYRLGLGIVMSVVLTVLLGFGLNALGTDPTSGRGYFEAGNLWIGLGVISAVLFLVGWWRGAYPAMGRLHPALTRLPKREPQSVLGDLDADKNLLIRLKTLAEERDRLRHQVRDHERRMKLMDADLRDRYARKRAEAVDRLREVDAELRRLEEERAKELYG